MLKQLQGYPKALISNVGNKGLFKALAHHGLQDKFGLIISRNDVLFLKPAAEGILKAISWAQVSTNLLNRKGI